MWKFLNHCSYFSIAVFQQTKSIQKKQEINERNELLIVTRILIEKYLKMYAYNLKYDENKANIDHVWFDMEKRQKREIKQ